MEVAVEGEREENRVDEDTTGRIFRGGHNSGRRYQKAGPALYACDPSRSDTQGPELGLRLCRHCLSILSGFQSMGPSCSFDTGPRTLFSWYFWKEA